MSDRDPIVESYCAIPQASAIVREARADERRKVIAELKEGLAELELHDDLPDSHDLGYMACWRDVRDLAASLLAAVEEGDGRNDKVLSAGSGEKNVAHNEETR